MGLLLCLFAIFLLLQIDSFAQAPATVWTKSFGSGTGNCVQQTTDNGFIIVGDNYDFVRLLKTDETGDTLWTKMFRWESNWLETNYGLFVRQTFDGGYIITGYTDTSETTFPETWAWLIKTDSSGNSIWTKNIGCCFALCVQQTFDGGYIIIGMGSIFSNVFWLIKTDSMGDTLWTKNFAIGTGHFVQQTFDGGYIIIGGSNSKVLLVKTDASGDTIWTKTFGGEYLDYGHSVQQTTDGGFIITGQKGIQSEPYQKKVLLIKTDSSGKMLWEKTFGEYNDDVGHSVQQTIDGGYIITGETGMWKDVLLIKTDSTGNKLWEKIFGLSGQHEYGNFVQQTSDEGYIITGHFDGLWLCKVAPDITYIAENSKKYIDDYILRQNYPNPFNTITIIKYSVPNTSKVQIKLFDVLSNEIATLVNEEKTAGTYELTWNAENLPSDVYFYQLRAGDFVETKKMVLMK